MRHVRSFLRLLESAVEKSWLGLPLRMIICCEWHSRHMVLLALGAAVFGIGYSFDIRELTGFGAAIAALPLFCFALFFPLILTLLVLDVLSGYSKTKAAE